MDWLSVNTEPLLRKRLLLWRHSPSRPGAATYYRSARKVKATSSGLGGIANEQLSVGRPVDVVGFHSRRTLRSMPYYIYVIELDDECEWCRNRPTARPSRCMYVGESYHPPDVRLQQHLAGIRPGRPFRMGCSKARLRPELYSHIPPVQDEVEAPD
jgi:hypothetical protein